MKYYKSKNCEIEFVLSENLKKNFGCHNHTSNYVVGLVLQGCVQLEKSHEQKSLCDNDIFIIPPYVTHTVSLNEDVRMLSVCIGVSFLEKYSINQAAGLLSECIDRLVVKNILCERQAEMLAEALAVIYSCHGQSRSDIPTEICTVSDIIVENPEQEISLNDLSERTYISKYYLIRKFKRSVGLTPRHFQIQTRIRKAQKLLCSGAKIAEAAADMGFYDQSHFNKYFNKIVGITPREYIGSIEELN